MFGGSLIYTVSSRPVRNHREAPFHPSLSPQTKGTQAKWTWTGKAGLSCFKTGKAPPQIPQQSAQAEAGDALVWSRRRCSLRGSGTTPWVKDLLTLEPVIIFSEPPNQSGKIQFSEEFHSLTEQVHTAPWHELGVFLGPESRQKHLPPEACTPVYFYFIFCQFYHSLLQTTARA